MGSRTETSVLPYEMLPDGGSTVRKGQAGGQSFAPPPTSGVTTQAQNDGGRPGLSRARAGHRSQSLGEDGLPAFSVPALPWASRKRDSHSCPFAL